MESYMSVEYECSTHFSQKKFRRNIKSDLHVHSHAGNKPFPSSFVPLFKSESKCETILMEMTLI